jgi:putative ABC transport system permease protein
MPDMSGPVRPPAWTDEIRRRLSTLQFSPSREREIVDELSQHLDDHWRELVEGGASPDDATRLTRAEFRAGNVLAGQMTALRQAHVRPEEPLGSPNRRGLIDTWQDFRYALRMLVKEPQFTLAAVLTLALGIGANSAIFALVDATLLRPLPFPDADRVVAVWEQTRQVPRGRVSVLNMLDWDKRAQTFEVIAGYVPSVGGMVLGGADGPPETISRQWVTYGVFDALGLKPIVGRSFQRADDEQELNAVVLSEGFWRSTLAADPAIGGKTLRLDGDLYTVVGVVADEAQVIGRASIWGLVSVTKAGPRARRGYPLHAIGRMKPGVALSAAQSDIDTVAAALAREYPDTNTGRSVALVPLRDQIFGPELKKTSTLFLGVVGLVLLICCANVANLLMTRATVRRRELAVRSALGASRARVVRQLVTESLVLAFIGGTLGLAVGGAILQAAPLVVPEALLPPVIALALDARVVAFCAIATLGAGLIFGLAPAWQATDFSVAHVMTSSSRSVTGRGGAMRGLLVAGQVGVAVVLLFGGGLLLRTLLAADGVDRGYRADSVLTMVVDPMSSEYPTDAAELQFYDAVLRDVSAVPGVRSAAWATTLPMGSSYEGSVFFDVVGDTRPADRQPPQADYQIVSLTYFDTVDLSLVAGRRFDERDRPGNPRVCIVNEAMAARHLGTGEPVGRQVAMRPTGTPDAAPVMCEVVGVARQVKGHPTESDDLLQVYVPLAQDTPGDIFLLVRSATEDASALVSPVRAAIARHDPSQLVSVRSPMTLDDVAAEATARYRFRAALVMAFSVLALTLAMVGLFGVMAYSVQQHVRDFGVRRALGASTGAVVRLVAGRALRVIGAGAVVGLALTPVVGSLLQTLLFGVTPMDPATFAGVAAVVILGGLASAVGPAWRAARVDPATALRSE